MRKHCRRKVITPMPPPGMRPKLAPDQVRDLGISHIQNLDAIAKGEADEATLWQWVGGVLTWSKAAELFGRGIPEMNEQLELTHSVITRYGRTGRVVFTGPEYQIAKHGVDVMDALAEAVPKHIAIAAAEWSEAKVNELEAECRARAAMQYEAA